MPAKKLSEMSIAELEKKHGVKAKVGSISNVRGQYYLRVEGNEYQLEPNVILSSQPLDKLAKERLEVRVIFSKGKPVVVNWSRPTINCYIILCYIPVPDVRTSIDPAIRALLVKTLVKEQVIPQSLGRQLVTDIAAGF
jgi:hypothetical protein